MGLEQMLVQSAAKNPNKVVAYFKDQKITYGELDDRSHRLARALASLGVKEGDRIALFLPNGLEFLICECAILRLGAMMVAVGAMLKREEVRHILNDSAASILITVRELLTSIELLGHELPTIKAIIVVDEPVVPRTLSYHRLLQEAGDAPLPGLVDPEAGACILYTAGTTGKPKGAVLSHRNMETYLRYFALARGTKGDDVPLIAGNPLTHLMGQGCFLTSLCHDLSFVLMERFDPGEVLATIPKYRITYFGGVPTMYVRLLAEPGISACDFSSLRVCSSGTAPLPVELLQRWEAKTGAMISEGYGLTETTMVTYNIVGRERRLGSVGVPVGENRVRIADGNDQDVPLGEVGEILVQSPAVMKGYYNNPAATAEALRGGWMHTGDLGRVDEEGYLYLVDRKQDMIISGGYNVYSAEIEQVLYDHPQVELAAVVGVPDDIRGEVAKAYVVLKAGQEASAEELIAFCRERLAAYKAPCLVEFRSSLPLNPMGKVLKRFLKEEAAVKAAGGRSQ